MKGIVLQRLNDKIIVLTNNGDFIEIDKPDDFVDIGEEIVINTPAKDKKLIFRRFIYAAAVFLLFFIGGYGAYGYYTPKGYVNVDINPSIEIAYNLYGEPIKLRALNEDGNKVIKKIDKSHLKSVDIAINEIIKISEEERFISKEKENTIIITITELNKKIDAQNLEKAVDNYVKESKIAAKIILLKGDKKIYEKAKEQNISPCKLILIDQAKEKSSGNELNDIDKKSVKEIINIINEEEHRSNELQKEKTDKIKSNADQKISMEKEEGKSENTQYVKKENDTSKEKTKEYKNQQKEKEKENKEKEKENKEKEKENKEKEKEKAKEKDKENKEKVKEKEKENKEKDKEQKKNNIKNKKDFT